MSNRINDKIQNLHFPFAVELITSDKRKKTVSFEVYPTKLIVRIPSTLSSKTLEDVLRKHRQQLITKWNSVTSSEQQTTPDRELREKPGLLPDKVSMYGTSHALIQRFSSEGKHFSLQLQNEGVIVTIPRGMEQDSTATRMVRDLVVSWLRKTARSDFLNRLNHHAIKMQVTYKDFRLKDQKTRWGSCSSLGNINLNWRLIQAPEWVIDYVVIHELAHLEELNHSQAFWRIVKRHCPYYQDAKKWLRDNGHELHRW